MSITAIFRRINILKDAQKALFSSSSASLSTRRPANLPLPPKRPPTAFAMFVKESRPSFIQSNPDLKATEVLSQLSKEWNGLPDFDKHRFKERYSELRDKYELDVKEFSDGLTSEEKEGLKHWRNRHRLTKKQVRYLFEDPRKPKKPLSSYQIFLVDAMRSRRYVNVYGPKLFKEVGADWRDLDPDEREVYVKRQEKQKAEYDDAMKFYNAAIGQASEEEY